MSPMQFYVLALLLLAGLIIGKVRPDWIRRKKTFALAIGLFVALVILNLLVRLGPLLCEVRWVDFTIDSESRETASWYVRCLTVLLLAGMLIALPAAFGKAHRNAEKTQSQKTGAS